MTKALAAAMTTVLVLWVGIDTLLNLIAGWLRLTEEVKEAHTFVEIREAGERFGKVIGRDAARAFAMLAMAAIGQTAQGFAAKVQTLPGSAQVMMQAEGEAALWLPAVGAVREVAVTAEGLQRLRRAMVGCRSVEACREDLTSALKRLGREIATPGTELNQLITRTQPR